MRGAKTSFWRAVWLASLFLLLAACSGSGGDTNGNSPPTPLPDTLGMSVPTSAEAGLAVAMNSAVVATGDLKLEWSFGDGRVGQGVTTSHTFEAAGDFEVVLRASNGAGQSREERRLITVNRTARLRGLACSGANGQGWCSVSPITPPPSGNRLYAVQFVDPQNGWAVGDMGEIQHTSDGGATWQPQSSGITSRLNRVVFKNATEGWVYGSTYLSSPTLLRTVDGGRRWDLVKLPVRTGGYMEFSLLTGGVPTVWLGFCSSHSGCRFDIFFTQDGGVIWIKGGSTEQGGLSVPAYPYAIEAPGGTIWSFDGPRNRGSIYKAVDFGLNRSKVLEKSRTLPAQLLVFDDQSVLYVGALTEDSGLGYPTEPSTVSASTYLLTRDGGATWQPLSPKGLPAGGRFGNYWLTATTPEGHAVLGIDADFYVTRDFGATWALAGSKPSAPPAAGSTEWLQRIGSGALLYEGRQATSSDYSRWLSADLGKSWTRLNTPSATTSIQIQSSVGGNTLIGMGSEGQIYKSTNIGSSWTEIRPAGLTPQTIRTLVTHLVSVNPDRLLRRQDDYVVSASADFGQTWTALADQPWGSSTSSYEGDGDLAFSSPTQGWLRNRTGLYGTADGGVSWSLLNKPDLTGATFFEQVYFIGDLRGWALNLDRRILSTVDGGLSWTVVSNEAFAPTYLPGSLLRFLSPLDGFLFYAGDAYTSRDGGKSWLPSGQGLTDTGTLRRLAVADARTLVGLTFGDIVVRSTDAGDSWTPVPSAPAGRWNDMYFRKQLGWLVGDSGRIAVTRDGGATWKEVTTGIKRNLARVAFADDRTGWVTTDDGVVYSTGTGGQ
jgi:photosystem II stability/assembly factor-like uncharacterized protein